ncbi:hypothetical protein BJ912DRAFT_1058380 [Pholiota molesta]|nr:hypothetical protein BJ912DRAFT_1058380 [Pholiota molesta]
MHHIAPTAYVPPCKRREFTTSPPPPTGATASCRDDARGPQRYPQPPPTTPTTSPVHAPHCPHLPPHRAAAPATTPREMKGDRERETHQLRCTATRSCTGAAGPCALPRHHDERRAQPKRSGAPATAIPHDATANHATAKPRDGETTRWRNHAATRRRTPGETTPRHSPSTHT